MRGGGGVTLHMPGNSELLRSMRGVSRANPHFVRPISRGSSSCVVRVFFSGGRHGVSRQACKEYIEFMQNRFYLPQHIQPVTKTSIFKIPLSPPHIFLLHIMQMLL